MTPDVPVHDFAKLAAPAIPPPTKEPKVFIGLCTRDWLTETLNSESVRNFGRYCKFEIMPFYMMNDGVARSRNNLAAHFLESDCTHLFYFDSDIVMEPHQLDRLVERNKPIVGGMYPKKQGKLDWVMNMLPNEVPDENGLLRVKHIGCGCMLITREALLATMEKHPEIMYRGDPGPETKRWDFFPMRAVDGAYLSEDWAFCDRARADGFELFMDTKCFLRHVGKIVYPLQFTMSDDEAVDLFSHRYGIGGDQIRAFMASGTRQPGLMGGARERRVRFWPAGYTGIADLHHGDVLGGCYDLPGIEELETKPVTIIDVGADVGAFAIWAAKRWPGATIHSYEGRPDIRQFLEATVERLRHKHPQGKFAVHPESPAPQSVDGFPVAQILKIDEPGKERDIVMALQGAGRLVDFTAIVLRCYAESDATFLTLALDATHALHCRQMLTEGRSLLKFLRRSTVAA